MYRKGPQLRFLSHLDMLRAMERAIRRAGLPLAYSEGFTPHPKLAFAPPLPLGFEGEAEIVDITLTERTEPSSVADRIAQHSSADLQPYAAYEVSLREPSPQASSRWADYRLELPEIGPEAARSTIAEFLDAESFPWTETRQNKQRSYDLRSLVVSIESCPAPGGRGTQLRMRLASGPDATGRPEQVIAALFPDSPAHGHARTAIVLAEHSPARKAWKLVGQYL